MFFSLPLGQARLERPPVIFRYTFEHFAHGVLRPVDGLPTLSPLAAVPIESVRVGDVQVLAACEQGKERTPTIDLNVLADFPTVDSVIASTRLQAGRELPGIRELLLTNNAPMPDTATLRCLTGLETLYTFPTNGDVHLNLDALPAGQMRKLAANRWLTKSLAPLERMTSLEQLKLSMFREPLDAVAGMKGLSYLSIHGPAKGWAKLRECTQLEEANLIDVQIANLRRWNTWKQLRIFVLAGRGIKSLAGLESLDQLEELTLLNLKTQDLSPLRGLSRLSSLTLRMPAGGVDVASVGWLPQLRALVIDDAAQTDSEVMRIPTVKPLAKVSGLAIQYP